MKCVLDSGTIAIIFKRLKRIEKEVLMDRSTISRKFEIRGDRSLWSKVLTL